MKNDTVSPIIKNRISSHDLQHHTYTYLQVKFLEYVGKGQMLSLRNMTDSMVVSDTSAADGAEDNARSESESFLDVIRRTKNAAHLVAESAVWGCKLESHNGDQI